MYGKCIVRILYQKFWASHVEISPRPIRGERGRELLFQKKTNEVGGDSTQYTRRQKWQTTAEGVINDYTVNYAPLLGDSRGTLVYGYVALLTQVALG